MARRGEFSQGPLVIEVSSIKIFCACQVCLPSVRSDAKRRLDRRFRERQTCRTMIEAKEVKLVRGVGKLAIGLEKRRITGDSLVQQIGGLEQILPRPAAKQG